MRNLKKPHVVALGIALPCLALLAADGPTQTIRARNMTFEAPKAWKSVPPTGPVRSAQLTVAPAKGDKDPAELIVVVFPGIAGTVDQNVKRWQGQFEGPDGQPPKAVTEKRKGKNVDVTFVEIAGRYVARLQPGSTEKNDKPNYRLLGAIIETPEAGFYLKMVGPEKTMKEAKGDFDKLIKSISVEG
jgi:hypothetical protein